MELDEFQKAFGTKLREMREKEGLSICQLAKKSGISKGLISASEKGKQNVCLDTIRRLSAACRAEPYILLYFKEGGEQ